MKVVRRFKWVEDSDFGAGFAPTHIPQADPVFSGMTAAHDVLEHLFDKVGDFEGEMMALGAMHLVRADMDNKLPMYELQYGDISNFVGDLLRGKHECKPPKKAVKLRQDHRFDSEEMLLWIRRGIMGCLRECAGSYPGRFHDLVEQRRYLPKNLDRIILEWMNLGFEEADRFSNKHNVPPCEWAGMFSTISQEFERKMRWGEPGSAMRVTLDFDNGRAWVEHKLPYARAYE
jgi:hypothetical protein